MKGCVHAWERLKRALVFYLWLPRGPVQAGSGSQGRVLSCQIVWVIQHIYTHRFSAKDGILTDSGHLRKFLTKPQLTTKHINQKTQWLNTVENTIYRISLGKSLINTSVTDPGGGRNLISRAVTLHYLTCPVFSEIFRKVFKETGKYGSHTGKQEYLEAVPEGSRCRTYQTKILNQPVYIIQIHNFFLSFLSFLKKFCY